VPRPASLQITAFRGIRDDTINIDGNSLVLYGENGTGKSSLVDALEFLLSGSVGHLEEFQTTSVKKHGPHVNFDSSRFSVSAT